MLIRKSTVRTADGGVYWTPEARPLLKRWFFQPIEAGLAGLSQCIG
jgi:hypothetical protein